MRCEQRIDLGQLSR